VSYLIDTNVLSELRRKTPHPGVVQWFAQRPVRSLFLSVLTLGEIRKGIEAINDVQRRSALLDWLEVDLPNFFTGRILTIDTAVADYWGRLMAKAGRSLPAIDSLLAATALHHDLTLVTRNIKDVVDCGVAILDPWNV